MIRENLLRVQATIEKAKSKRTSDMGDVVELVAVTKNHDVQAMREAIDATDVGVRSIGENRIQEAQYKYETLEREVRWHLIGHLQKNKSKYAVRMFDLIHSVDSLELARVLDREAEKASKIQSILVQVNLAKEDSKFGIYEEDLESLLVSIDTLEHLRIEGLMCIAPYYDEVERTRPLFRKMYEIFQKTKEIPFTRANIIHLSMGMTQDYPIAIEEGANIVRVGTGIFGARQY